ncbi:MAG: hypothetical protein FWH40_10125, partial [Coriobacteriia bacterium]|nr:hypothetical protein [Coriobacteriia bacterium]
MRTIRKRALAVLIGAVLAVAAFVAFPATAYAAADINLNTLGGADEDHSLDADPWKYETANETLTLLGGTSEYNLSGTNTSITIMVPSSAGNASVNFYNVAVHPSLVNKSAFVAEGSCSLFIYGDSSLSSNEADT